MGRIGQDLAKRLEAFKVKIAYSGHNQKSVSYAYFHDVYSLAKASEILFLACQATPKTNKMLNTEVLEAFWLSNQYCVW